MENAPLHPAAGDPDKKSGGKKKKKNAEALGVFVLDARPADKSAEQPESIWEKLTLSKRKGGETVEAAPLSQVFAEVEARQLPENDDSAEVETELEVLSQPEERFVERTIVEARRRAEPALNPGEAAEDSEAVGYETAAAEAVDLFRHKVVSGGEPIEQAFTATLQNLGAETPTQERSQEPPTAGQAHTAPKLSAEWSKEAPHRPETPLLDQLRESNSENFSIGPAAKESAEEAGVPDQNHSTAGVPPRPPRVPHLTAANYLPPTPAAPQSTKAEKEFVPYYNGGDMMGAALLGGLVGYLIGRRRGRIKTERKLKPIRKKLERRIMATERDIAAKEAHIRKMARRHAREQQRSQHVEQSMRRDQQRIEALEANQLHGKKVSPERIGRVVVTAGDKPRERTEAAKPERTKKNQPPKPVDKRIETMSRAELLDLSSKIPVENTTLRQVYETHLVGEQGLRRLVSEYTRGGDVQKALRAELVEHERDFERDPILRDRKRPSKPPTDHHQPTLETLLQKAGVFDQAEVREELATLKVRQAHQEQQHLQQQKHRRVLDVSMITIIAVLTALVIVLLLRSR